MLLSVISPPPTRVCKWVEWLRLLPSLYPPFLQQLLEEQSQNSFLSLFLATPFHNHSILHITGPSYLSILPFSKGCLAMPLFFTYVLYYIYPERILSENLNISGFVPSSLISGVTISLLKPSYEINIWYKTETYLFWYVNNLYRYNVRVTMRNL